MTELLETAFKEASRLPDVEQNIFARQMLEELVSERKWTQLFAKSENVLDRLADEALAEFERGVTLTKHCQEALHKAEQKVQILMQDQTLIAFETPHEWRLFGLF